MLKVRWVSAFMILGFLVAMQSFAETSVQNMISKSDHEGLANYYAQQAQELKEKAKHWEFTAEFYEKHSDPNAKTDSAQHAAHCRTIAQNYKKAAEEAGALASEHLAMRPHLRQ
jgi:hypothetical protein